jgi:hypothetical protein
VWSWQSDQLNYPISLIAGHVTDKVRLKTGAHGCFPLCLILYLVEWALLILSLLAF